MKTIIHVNRSQIAKNIKDDGNRPVYTVKHGARGKPRYAREVIIKGPSRMVYVGTQLSCGARAWVETESEVQLIDEMTYQDGKM
jgi:hypothetical protein